MLKVRIGKFKSRARGRKGWTVAVVLKTKTYKMISYQGRFKTKRKALLKKKALERELKQMIIAEKLKKQRGG